MHFGALAAFAAFVLVALVYRDPPGTPAAASARFALNLTRREWLLVLIAGVMWGLFNVAYIVLISFAPELFTVRGWSLAEASSIVSLIGWVLIPSDSALGIPDRTVRPADAVHGRGFRDHVRGADRPAVHGRAACWRSRSSRWRSACRPV